MTHSISTEQTDRVRRGIAKRLGLNLDQIASLDITTERTTLGGPSQVVVSWYGRATLTDEEFVAIWEKGITE